MKVLHIQKASGIGGSERHLLSLLPAIKAKGINVRMCVLTAQGSAGFVDCLQERDVEVSLLRAGPHFNPLLISRLAVMTRRFGADLVHTHLIHGDVHGQVAARALGVRGVSSFHSTLDFYRAQPVLAAARIAGYLAARTIAISEHVGRFVRDLGIAPSGRIRVVPYGIDCSAWTVSESERQRNRQRYGMDSQKVVVGIASRLVAGKGHSTLIRALRRAIPEVPGLCLLIAGDGPLAAELKRQAAALPPGRVRLVGFVRDMRSFMGVCDILAFPSRSEGFGLAALEAMASGRPVIAGNLGALPEIVADGRTGFLVPPHDPSQIADRLILLGRDEALRRSLGDEGRRRAAILFGLDSMVDRITSVYDEAASSAEVPGRLRRWQGG